MFINILIYSVHLLYCYNNVFVQKTVRPSTKYKYKKKTYKTIEQKQKQFYIQILKCKYVVNKCFKEEAVEMYSVIVHEKNE